jgi:mono/diheme cytochrome c family protein
MARARDIIRRLLIALALLVVIVVGVLLYSARRLSREQEPPRFASAEEHFLYGSIGTESDGIPYWVWLVLPRVFPEYLPGPGGYAALGLDTREGRDMPIGLSRVVTGGVSRVGMNCAFCHTARVRLRPGDISMMVPGAPGHQVNWDRYRRFLIASAWDPRFTSETLLAEIDRNYRLPTFERMLYKWAIIPRARRLLRQLAANETGDRPEIGAGRSAGFGVGALPAARTDPLRGASDIMPVWNLGRHGGAFYWDGINTKLPEVITAWALATGSPARWLDRDLGGSTAASNSIGRIQNYLSALTPPRYPLPIDQGLAKTGEAVFAAECASCHGAGGNRTGTVVPLDQVGTDRARADAWTNESVATYNGTFGGRAWGFSSFRKTNGYVAPPLEGLWIRAPYLHNGSVPSLADLLNAPEQRPKRFWRGYDLFDGAAVGFVSSGAEAERAGTPYDTTLPGNGNGGHAFGTTLEPERKRALLEYLKGL